MSTQASLTITYAGGDLPAGAQSSPGLTLEQAPLPAAQGVPDLQAMLSVVLGTGQAAQAYTSPDCPASVAEGEIVVPLTVWVWPSDLALNYTLLAESGTVSEPVRIEQEREWDQVINFEAETVLPFHCRDLSWSWSDLGAYSRTGGLIDPPPELRAEGSTILSSGDFLGVLRVRCLAIGYAHTITMTIPKNAASKITDIRNSVTASWTQDGVTRTATLDLQIPDCVADLAALCPDGELAVEKVTGEHQKDETVWVIYYNGCTGRVIVVRSEQP